MGDLEDYRIVDRRGLSQGRVFQHTHSFEVRLPLGPYADTVLQFDSMADLERWVKRHRWRLVEGDSKKMLRPMAVREDRWSDEGFAQRYMITSLTGRIWNRSMTRKAAMDRVRTSPLPGLRDLLVGDRAALVDRVLDDDSFMRRFAGTVPARVVEAIEDRVWELMRGAA
jgi:hypothetical protein